MADTPAAVDLLGRGGAVPADLCPLRPVSGHLPLHRAGHDADAADRGGRLRLSAVAAGSGDLSGWRATVRRGASADSVSSAGQQLSRLGAFLAESGVSPAQFATSPAHLRRRRCRGPDRGSSRQCAASSNCSDSSTTMSRRWVDTSTAFRYSRRRNRGYGRTAWAPRIFCSRCRPRRRQRRHRIIEGLRSLPVHIRTLPGMADLAAGRVSCPTFQELDLEDLLGRDPVRQFRPCWPAISLAKSFS